MMEQVPPYRVGQVLIHCILHVRIQWTTGRMALYETAFRDEMGKGIAHAILKRHGAKKGRELESHIIPKMHRAKSSEQLHQGVF